MSSVSFSIINKCCCGQQPFTSFHCVVMCTIEVYMYYVHKCITLEKKYCTHSLLSHPLHMHLFLCMKILKDTHHDVGPLYICWSIYFHNFEDLVPYLEI